MFQGALRINFFHENVRGRLVGVDRVTLMVINASSQHGPPTDSACSVATLRATEMAGVGWVVHRRPLFQRQRQ